MQGEGKPPKGKKGKKIYEQREEKKMHGERL
jgi:hypothetical protein